MGAGPSEAWRWEPESSYAVARLDDGAPARWDRCRSITWAVNPTGAPDGGVEDVREALRRTASATGLVFVPVGTTGSVPQQSWLRPGGWPAGEADLVVSWAVPAAPPGRDGRGSDLLPRDGTAGVGGWSAEYAAPGETEEGGAPVAHIRHGYVVLNAELDSRFTPGFTAVEEPLLGSRPAPRGRLLLHELGHAVGLAHVDDAGQVMHERVQSVDGSWGAGDRAGLRSLGSSAAPCGGASSPATPARPHP